MQIMSPAATPRARGAVGSNMATRTAASRRAGTPLFAWPCWIQPPPLHGGGRGGHNLHVLLPACVMTDSVLTDLPESAGFCQFLTIPDGPTALRSHALTVPRSSLH